MAKIEKTQHTTVNLGKGFLIEAPCFFDNIKELEAYIKGLGISYEYSHKGGGASLVSNFAAAFGDSFDSSIYTTTTEAFDIEIPEINVIYTHMLGHDCHSIVAALYCRELG